MNRTSIEIPPKEMYTYEDYARLPEGAPYQLIGGKLVMTPSPSTFHQLVLVRLLGHFLNYQAKENRGTVLVSPVDVYFNHEETFQPDIIFISRERTHIIEHNKINGAPDLVVEILSPSTAYYDLRKKYRVYERYGVKEYWIVDPEDETVEIYLNKDGRFILHQQVRRQGVVTSALLDGLKIEVAELLVQMP
ncbi:Uma2 family endonuclease [Desulfofundulus thermocisternus]|uniref:Uma2 family endonuclease n=1 Tax=Desulfofundulus thermocisternus TaxID=42471 RepID=UPI00217DD823|nr:Uma2 family endonuclease [Desulfofundulus thermocisternus]MCS5695371.1 Uma2 family endonuclease [Desulfofundulus thermocisternus]